MSNFALQLARRIEPRHLLIALAGVIVSFAILDYVYKHELDSLVAFHLDDSDPAVRNSLPAVVTVFCSCRPVRSHLPSPRSAGPSTQGGGG